MELTIRRRRAAEPPFWLPNPKELKYIWRVFPSRQVRFHLFLNFFGPKFQRIYFKTPQPVVWFRFISNCMRFEPIASDFPLTRRDKR